jgi:CheY-like chemotaxis protein
MVSMDRPPNSGAPRGAADAARALEMDLLGRLGIGLAHDFNNLLTIINGQSQWMLSRIRKNDPMRHGIEQILRAGEQASELTRQLLDFTRRQPASSQWLDLNQLLDRLRPILPRLVGVNVALQVETRASGQRLLADPRQLELAIMNLVANAGDSMPSGGSLSIATSNRDLDRGALRDRPGLQPGSYFVLSVSDTGAGIETASRLGMFGHSQAQQIVEQSGGIISFESEIGRGATFDIYWPVYSESPTPNPGTSENMPVTPARVVVVDDYPAVRTWIRDVLEFAGLPVTILEAADGGEAIRLVRDGGVDLVITDLIMPNQEGIETIQVIRRDAPNVRILAISGAQSDYLTMARALGADAALQKPLSADTLLQAVANLLPKP